MERRGGSFFGRRKGKALRPGQKQALETVLPELLIDLSQPPPAPFIGLFSVPVSEIHLEIGFGGGEHLLSEARARPDVGFIGVEPYESGLAKAVTALAREAIRNVQLFDQDATLLLDWLPAASLARIDLLFPDPWPKARHAKRRFVNPRNLDRIAHCLEPGGLFRFATDIEDYAVWTRDAVARHGLLVSARAVGEETAPWETWPGTRYEAKAKAAGRPPAYLIFRKTG
jgi:tRNA (guanine-N7-)-methyltransferase